MLGGGPLGGHGDDLQSDQLPSLDQLLDLLAGHRSGGADGKVALLRHERPAPVARLDEPVTDEEADRLAGRAEAHLVTRSEIAVPRKLVAWLQDAASRSAREALQQSKPAR